MSPSVHPGWLIIAAAGVALIPTVIALFTSYAKVSIVLGMIRTALGTQQVPSGLVVMALSLALSVYTMAPVVTESADRAFNLPASSFQTPNTLADLSRFTEVLLPFRRFLERHAGEREIAFLATLEPESGVVEPLPPPKLLPSEVPLKVLMPAFVLTELKEAFAMALMLLLPFLVVDIVVANLLVALGMVMVQPATIALPLKLVLFVIADGWLLVTKGLILSYTGAPG